MTKIITEKAIERRNFWIEEIRKISGNFGDDFEKLKIELEKEINDEGILVLIDHLRLCGSIPESYSHDSSEEKLYSKYTDCLLALTFNALGLKSLVLTERSDAADVEVVGNDFSFVADAKAFRLSRTAKNQKDFKVDAMHGWKRGKTNAMVVAPIYQLPRASSQIYQSALIRDVCIFTYSHLSLLLNFLSIEGEAKTQALLHKVFKAVPLIPPSKNSTDYWMGINKTLFEFSESIEKLWLEEKQASIESIRIAKEVDLTFLARQREQIMKMSHKEALEELIRVKKIDSKIITINEVDDNGLFEIK
ncbi:HindIII family type II restriction endonuclease [Emticicia agri]|uniref:HindIII family type II restriction endonuclease n=1 Tax=Emticicia agri TaxID=2492393 RepID=A0A4Q5LT36_9BACT|nr:HindIII family type II restriction endonuclease [Emticicia agri]RYU92778.1 HindIII family type II restriction endonuclease [Emticicia agri]